MWQHRSSPLRKTESGAMEHVTAPELILARRQGLELRDMWQRRSSPQQGGEVRGHGTHGSTGAHLIKEARSEAAGHVAVPELTSSRRRGPELRGTWQRRSSPQQGGEVWGRGTRDGARAHLYREV
jgi:hypothetical protein